MVKDTDSDGGKRLVEYGFCGNCGGDGVTSGITNDPCDECSGTGIGLAPKYE